MILLSMDFFLWKKTQGIRILGKIDGVVIVKLSDILQEVYCGDFFHWAILYSDAIGDLGENIDIAEFEKKINKSPTGFSLIWKELETLAMRFSDILILGCKDKNQLHRYDEPQEMYEACDIVIEMVDSNFWEVFSRDKHLIDRLAEKFKEIKFLEPDFER
jgi:hypothetical protein